MIRVLLVEDHPLIRMGIESLIAGATDLTLVAHVASLSELRRVHGVVAEVVLLDLGLPDATPATTLAAAQELGILERTLILTASDSEDLARRALKLGARGFLRKSVAPTQLVASVRAVAHGLLVSGDVRAASADAELALTPRELDVLRLVAVGSTNGEVGTTLGLSLGTVRTHVSSALRKLGAAGRAEAVAILMRRGDL